MSQFVVSNPNVMVSVPSTLMQPVPANGASVAAPVLITEPPQVPQWVQKLEQYQKDIRDVQAFVQSNVPIQQLIASVFNECQQKIQTDLINLVTVNAMIGALQDSGIPPQAPELEQFQRVKLLASAAVVRNLLLYVSSKFSLPPELVLSTVAGLDPVQQQVTNVANPAAALLQTIKASKGYKTGSKSNSSSPQKRVHKKASKK